MTMKITDAEPEVVVMVGAARRPLGHLAPLRLDDTEEKDHRLDPSHAAQLRPCVPISVNGGTVPGHAPVLGVVRLRCLTDEAMAPLDQDLHPFMRTMDVTLELMLSRIDSEIEIIDAAAR